MGKTKGIKINKNAKKMVFKNCWVYQCDCQSFISPTQLLCDDCLIRKYKLEILSSSYSNKDCVELNSVLKAIRGITKE